MIKSALAILRGSDSDDFTQGSVFALRSNPWAYENSYAEVFLPGNWGTFRLFKLK